MTSRWGFTTKAVHGGKMADTHKSVAPPIYQTATFSYDTAEEGARLLAFAAADAAVHEVHFTART